MECNKVAPQYKQKIILATKKSFLIIISYQTNAYLETNTKIGFIMPL